MGFAVLKRRRLYFGQREDGEALGNVALQPLRWFRRGIGVGRDYAGEFSLGACEIDGVPDGPELSPDGLADGEGWGVVDGVLCEVELASLPGRAGQDGLAGDPEARVIVTGDETDAVEAAIGQALDELAPVDFSLKERDREAQNAALAILTDPDRRQDGGVAK